MHSITSSFWQKFIFCITKAMPAIDNIESYAVLYEELLICLRSY